MIYMLNGEQGETVMHQLHSSPGTLSLMRYTLSIDLLSAGAGLTDDRDKSPVFFHIAPAFGIGAASSAT